MAAECGSCSRADFSAASTAQSEGERSAWAEGNGRKDGRDAVRARTLYVVGHQVVLALQNIGTCSRRLRGLAASIAEAPAKSVRTRTNRPRTSAAPGSELTAPAFDRARTNGLPQVREAILCAGASRGAFGAALAQYFSTEPVSRDEALLLSHRPWRSS